MVARARYDKSRGFPADGLSPIPVADRPTQNVNIQSATHQVGETKSFNGTTYRLNEHHRWERANPEEGSQGGVPGAEPGAQPPGQPPEAAAPPPSPAADPAARNSFTASRLHTVHPEVGGLLRAIHESPHFQQSGEFASYDVHKKVAGDLYHTLTKHAGKDIAGGSVVDLGEGRVGFASEAGSIAVWPADASGRHQITYTNKTGVVGRAMAKGGGQDGQPGQEPGQQQPSGEQPAAAGGNNQPPVENGGDEPEAPPLPAEPEAPPLPAQSGQRGQSEKHPGGGGNPFRQQNADKNVNNSGQSGVSARTPGGKLPDEQAYDDSLTPAKPRAPHIALRERANQWKEKAVAARDAWTQAVEDHEHPKRIRKLKQQFSALREAYNDHERHARKAEGEHRAKMKETGKATKERMKQLGIGPYKPKEKPAKPEKGQAGVGDEKPAKPPKKEPAVPLIDHAEQNPGKGDVPTPTPEALEMGKLPMESQRAGSAAQTFLKSAGLSVTPENHKAIQHAIRRGWVKNKAELRAMLRTAKKIHEKGGTHNYQELRGIKDPKERGRRRSELASNDHHALKDAIRRKANRERRESWAKIVKTQADAWDMTPQDYHEIASKQYKEFAGPHQERNDIKDQLMKMTGTNARKLRQIEERGGKGGKGGDYSNVKGLDNAAEYLTNNYPHLVKDGNAEQAAWDLLREGKQKVPGKTSQEFTDHMGDFLQNGMGFGGGAGGGSGEDGEGGGYSPEEIAEMERQNAATPFAKVRAGVVIRYRKWRKELENGIVS